MSEEVKAGHWATPEGAEMAQRYASKTREQIPYGGVTDFELANRIFMADRGSLELIGYQTAAKERIRWLSAHLAATEARAEAAEASVLKLLEDYAASIESMSCKEYLVDKLAATGVSSNVTLAYGRVQGIRMAADKIRASRTLKGTPDGR